MRKIPKVLFVCMTFLATPAFAQDGPDWLSDGNSLPKGVVSNDNVMVKQDSSPFSLTVAAERALKSDKPDKAIELIQRSLELNKEDLEAHMIYAMALERKLSKQATEDPVLFNRCVKEWLSVLRNSYGEEKGETFHGIGIPGLNGKWFEDEDRQRPARQHLIKLTGFSPKPWETNEKFLTKVQRSGETSVSAKLINNSTKQKNAESKSSTDETPLGKSSSRAGSQLQ